MFDPIEMMEEAAIEQMNHPDMYEQDIDAAADEYEASKPPHKVVNDNINPWEPF